jgi:hypothetical protein
VFLMSSGYPNQFQTPFDQGHPGQGYSQPGYGESPPDEPYYDWNSFDPNSEEYQDYRAPDGSFPFVVTDAKMQQSKNGNLMLKVRMELHGNSFPLSPQFMMGGENPDWVARGKRDLAGLVKALGLPYLKNGPKALIGLKGIVKISHNKVMKNGEEKEYENLKFSPLGGQPGAVHQAPPVQQAPPAQPQPSYTPPPGSLPPSQMAQYHPPQPNGNPAPVQQPQAQGRPAPWGPQQAPPQGHGIPF